MTKLHVFRTSGDGYLITKVELSEKSGFYMPERGKQVYISGMRYTVMDILSVDDDYPTGDPKGSVTVYVIGG